MVEARKKCPKIIFAHVATFKKGHTEWSYNNNERPNKQLHKVSLTPYRRESRKIFELLQRTVSLIEKASIDETYMDLGELVHKELTRLFPQLSDIKPHENLPDPPKLDDLPEGYSWTGRIIGSNDDEYQGQNVGLDLYGFENDQKKQEPVEKIQHINTNEEPSNLMSKYEKKMNTMEPKKEEPVEVKNNVSLEIDDWDDVCLLIGSKIVKDLRQSVLDELGYTCSVGLSRNKALSKLGSGILKPATQNIIRSAVIPMFLERFEITDMWGLGGKLGQQLIKRLDIPNKGSIPYLLQISRDQLQRKISPKLTKQVIKLIRGTDSAPVVNRIDIKTMASVKNFNRFPLKGSKDVIEWLKVYAADLAGRLVELCELKDKEAKSDYIVSPVVQYYPKSLSLAFKSEHRTAQYQKQMQFPTGVVRKSLEKTLFETGCKLLKILESDVGGPNKRNTLYPCESLSLEIHGFTQKTDIGAPGSSQMPLSSFFKASKNEMGTFAGSQSNSPARSSSESPSKCDEQVKLESTPSIAPINEKPFLFDDDDDSEKNIETGPFQMDESPTEAGQDYETTEAIKDLSLNLEQDQSGENIAPSLGSSILFGARRNRKSLRNSPPKPLHILSEVSSQSTATSSEFVSSQPSFSLDSQPSTFPSLNSEPTQPATDSGFDHEPDLFVNSQPDNDQKLTVRCSRCKNDIALQDLFSHEDWHKDQDALKARKKGSASLTSFFKSQPSFKAVPEGTKTKPLLGGIPKPIALSKRPPDSKHAKNKDFKRPKLAKNQTFLKFE